MMVTYWETLASCIYTSLGLFSLPFFSANVKQELKTEDVSVNQ